MGMFEFAMLRQRLPRRQPTQFGRSMTPGIDSWCLVPRFSIEVEAADDSASATAFAMIRLDTGADMCILPTKVASIIGIARTAESYEYSVRTSAGIVFQAWSATVRLRIRSPYDSFEWTAEVGFVPPRIMPDGREIEAPALLGISGGLEHFLYTMLVLNEVALEAPVLRIVTPA